MILASRKEPAANVQFEGCECAEPCAEFYDGFEDYDIEDWCDWCRTSAVKSGTDAAGTELWVAV